GRRQPLLTPRRAAAPSAPASLAPVVPPARRRERATRPAAPDRAERQADERRRAKPRRASAQHAGTATSGQNRQRPVAVSGHAAAGSRTAQAASASTTATGASTIKAARTERPNGPAPGLRIKANRAGQPCSSASTKLTTSARDGACPSVPTNLSQQSAANSAADRRPRTATVRPRTGPPRRPPPGANSRREAASPRRGHRADGDAGIAVDAQRLARGQAVARRRFRRVVAQAAGGAQQAQAGAVARIQQRAAAG